MVGEAKVGEDGEKRFPKDKAAGVGIILSKAAQAKVTAFGSISERVCYVRIEGPVCSLFVVATYFPIVAESRRAKKTRSLTFTKP